MDRDKQPLTNIKVSKHAFISLDKYQFVIKLLHYDTDPLIVSGNFGAHGDWTIEELLIAAQRVKTIKDALSEEDTKNERN